MARVKFAGETYDYDDDALETFFGEVLNEGTDLTEFLGSLQTEKRLALQDYMIYRLAEAHPGYITSE